MTNANKAAGQWSTVQLAGHPCDVFEPTTLRAEPLALIYLHGVHLARLSENSVYTELLGRHGLYLLAPHTQRSWWTDRVCAEFDPLLTAERHVRVNAVQWIAERWSLGPPRIGLWGTSMGGQGALRIAFKFPNLFPVVAALAPAIDYQLRYEDYDDATYDTVRAMYVDTEAARQDTATLHVHPLNWPRNIFFASDPADHRWHDSAQKLHMKLSALGIPHEHDLETSAGGHSWNYYNHQAEATLRFLVARLEAEQRRVV